MIAESLVQSSNLTDVTQIASRRSKRLLSTVMHDHKSCHFTGGVVLYAYSGRGQAGRLRRLRGPSSPTCQVLLGFAKRSHLLTDQ